METQTVPGIITLFCGDANFFETFKDACQFEIDNANGDDNTVYAPIEDTDSWYDYFMHAGVKLIENDLGKTVEEIKGMFANGIRFDGTYNFLSDAV